jgi:probable rRNA maturation factor
MPELVETLIEDDRWLQVGVATCAEIACRATLLELGLDPTQFEIALLACDDQRIAVLNADFRDKPTPTNVLSWPAQELAPQTEGQQPDLPESDGFGDVTELGDKALGDHVSHLLVHGCLHLLGYDHVLEKDAVLMEALEVSILAKLGIADPY